MIRAILFDLDGVIIDSEPLHCEAWSHAIVTHGGEPITWEAFLEQFYGYADTEIVKKLPHPLSQKSQEILRAKNTFFCSHLEKIKMVPEIIRFIQSKKKAMGLVTNALKVEVELMLEYVKVKGAFDVIVTANDVTYPKPNREPYNKAFLELAKKVPGLEKKDVLVIEDSDVGVASARSAGLLKIMQRDFASMDVIKTLQNLR